MSRRPKLSWATPFGMRMNSPGATFSLPKIHDLPLDPDVFALVDASWWRETRVGVLRGKMYSLQWLVRLRPTHRRRQRGAEQQVFIPLDRSRNVGERKTVEKLFNDRHGGSRQPAGGSVEVYK